MLVPGIMRRRSRRGKHRSDLVATRGTAAACAAPARDLGHAARAFADQALDGRVGHGGAITNDHDPYSDFEIHYQFPRELSTAPDVPPAGHGVLAVEHSVRYARAKPFHVHGMIRG